MNIKHFPKTPIAKVLCIVLSSASFASFAQEEVKAKDVKAKGSALEVIEVTARKRIESVQTVPSSINAVTGENIQAMGVHTVEDLSKYVPGLEQPQLANHSRLSLRGVSSGDNQSFEQSVGTYVDGVYRGRMNPTAFRYL
ncbi:TonB-dependent receptor plug domain-containing protein [Colwellia sp. MSW7]|uniref:TonB-dependent receptor plug domain-containing protein n=1 Tax=Colwellia maritima TaxID=2912588 RepID=A0ABS9WXZ9_9GAMM|nr:Plug domain-containing protein [Colwellia maritima]MCI2282071.1 TonB-dependent receptor plug domain-containing protein [Colwellia maritima]